MKFKHLIVSLLILTFLIVSCAPVVINEDERLNGALDDEDGIEIPVKDEVIDAVDDGVIGVDKMADKKVIEKNMDDFDQQLAKLLEKSKDVQNYKYLLDISTKNVGGNFEESGYWVWRIGNKVRIGQLDTVILGSESYTDIFLDLDEKTAVGRCLYRGVSCENHYEKRIKLNFDAVSEFLSLRQLINEIPSNAKVIGTKMVDNRDSLSVEYEEDGKIIEVAIEKYYGVPVRKVTSTLDNQQRITQQKILIQRLEVNQLVDAELDSDLVEIKVRK